jgi:hypothetical protein
VSTVPDALLSNPATENVSVKLMEAGPVTMVGGSVTAEIDGTSSGPEVNIAQYQSSLLMVFWAVLIPEGGDPESEDM